MVIQSFSLDKILYSFYIVFRNINFINDFVYLRITLNLNIMKKITFLIALMITSLGFAQPTTSPPVPTKNASDVVSIYGDTYTSIATNLNPGWGQSGTVNAAYNPGNGNLCLAYTNFNYQGTNITTTDLSSMEYLHIDVWTNKAPSNFILQVSPVNISAPSEVLVTINHVQGAWYSVDIPKSSFTGMTWNSVKELKFAANGSGSTPPGDIYLDNIYFWKTPPPAGTPAIGLLTVPAKKVGDAAFNLTDPTSNSSGAFSYTSSNTAVATISGKTVTIVGAGSSVITAIQAASAPYLSGSVTATLVVEAFPTTAAPTPPTRPTADVISFFSDAYTNIPVAQWSADWDDSNIADVTIDGNTTKKVDFGNFIGVILGDYTNCSAMTHFHMDYYINAGTDLVGKVFNPKLSNHAAKAGETGALLLTNLPTEVGKWVSLDVPLSTFAPQGAGVAFSRESIKEFLITSNIGVVFVDNIYLHKNTLGTQKFDVSNVKMYPNPVKNILTISANSEIQKVSVRNILGQEVLKSTPRSNTATLQTNTLQKGVYMVTTEIDGKLSTSKVIKE